MHFSTWLYFTEKINFKGGSLSDSSATKTELQFIPKADFNGDVHFSVESYLATPNMSYLGIAYCFSPEVAQALKTVIKVGTAWTRSNKLIQL